MKVSGFALAVLIASVLSSRGQLAVEVTQDQHQFLQGEALNVAVRISNRSGQTLHLGEEDAWLKFNIEAREGSPVSKLSDPQVKGGFDLQSSHVAIKRADLASHFQAMVPGRYAIVATVFVKGWDREISSPPLTFDIIEGAKLWEQEVGIPGTAGASGTPELRRYILQQANYLKGQLRLYLRIVDSYGKTYCVSPVGRMLSFSRPEPQIDKFSHLHLLYQNGAATFSYTAYDVDGTLLARQTFDYVGSKPHLRMDDDGIVSVFGGTRRFVESDVPPQGTTDTMVPVETNELPKPKL